MVWTSRKILSRIFGVVRLLLETHELDVDDVEALVRLGQEFAQQVVHGTLAFAETGMAPDAVFR